jgi:hypothetical protein
MLCKSYLHIQSVPSVIMSKWSTGDCCYSIALCQRATGLQIQPIYSVDILFAIVGLSFMNVLPSQNGHFIPTRLISNSIVFLHIVHFHAMLSLLLKNMLFNKITIRCTSLDLPGDDLRKNRVVRGNCI